MSTENKRTFEECYDEIAVIVEKKRYEWTFKASIMTDFDDIKSQIITHIWTKWDTYDQSRPLGGWVATIVRHQFINVLRDTYTSTSSPCARCPANLGNERCKLFEYTESQDCALFKKWYATKRHSHNARLPVTLENHMNEVQQQPDNMLDLEGAIKNLHVRMKEELTNSEWDIYHRLYIEHKTEEQTARELGFKTTEQGRKMGYKRIRQVKTLIFKKAKKLIADHGIETIR